MTDGATATVIAETDDVEELANQARDLLSSGLQMAIAHNRDTHTKTTCSITIDICQSKDEEDEVIIKLIPKVSLPQQTHQVIGEFETDGVFRIVS